MSPRARPAPDKVRRSGTSYPGRVFNNRTAHDMSRHDLRFVLNPSPHRPGSPSRKQSGSSDKSGSFLSDGANPSRLAPKYIKSDKEGPSQTSMESRHIAVRALPPREDSQAQKFTRTEHSLRRSQSEHVSLCARPMNSEEARHVSLVNLQQVGTPATAIIPGDTDLSPPLSFPCDKCNAAFLKKRLLKKHIRRIHEPKTHACELCDRRFPEKFMLTRHVTFVHENVRNLPCPHCDSRFHQKYGLNRHVNSVHKRERRHRCEQCGFSFLHWSHLVSHERIVHRAEAKYKCIDCDIPFSRKKEMNRHMLLMHER